MNFLNYESKFKLKKNFFLAGLGGGEAGAVAGGIHKESKSNKKIFFLWGGGVWVGGGGRGRGRGRESDFFHKEFKSKKKKIICRMGVGGGGWGGRGDG